MLKVWERDDDEESRVKVVQQQQQQQQQSSLKARRASAFERQVAGPIMLQSTAFHRCTSRAPSKSGSSCSLRTSFPGRCSNHRLHSMPCRCFNKQSSALSSSATAL
jgi:hypothetical protein